MPQSCIFKKKSKTKPKKNSKPKQTTLSHQLKSQSIKQNCCCESIINKSTNKFINNAFSKENRFLFEKIVKESSVKKHTFKKNCSNKKSYYRDSITTYRILDWQFDQIICQTQYNQNEKKIIIVPEYFLNNQKIVERLSYYIDCVEYFLRSAKEEHQGLIPFLDLHISTIDIILLISSYIFMEF